VYVVAGQLVVGFDGAHASQDRGVLYELRESRKVLADLDTRHRGFNRPELSANAIWRIGLEVESVQMARTARHPEQDARFRLRLFGRMHREPAQPTEQRRSRRGARQESPPVDRAGY
jgi:hypothetical protein